MGVAQQKYSVTDLGALGGNNSIPFRINNQGQVIGVAETSQPDPNSPGSLIFHAFFWNEGVMHDLGTLVADSTVWNSLASGVNNNGWVVGWSNTGAFDPVTGAPETRAFVWHDGVMTDLGTLGGNNSFANEINDAHQVAGVTEIPTVDSSIPPLLEFHAFLWERGVMNDLGTLEVGHNSFANDINDRGEVVGASQVNPIIDPLLGFPNFHSFLWKKGMMSELTAQELHGSNAFTINNQAQVVGRFAVNENGVPVSHAFLLEKGVTLDLGTVLGLQDSEALSINNKGQIVGDSGVGPIESFSNLAAWLLDNGVMTDLNTLIPADSGFQLIVAFDINARGQIVACGVETSTGNVHAVLLDPVNGNSGSTGRAGTTRRLNITLSEHARRLLARGKRRAF
jgi:probable HAF family extracellular repeat protein